MTTTADASEKGEESTGQMVRNTISCNLGEAGIGEEAGGQMERTKYENLFVFAWRKYRGTLLNIVCYTTP